VCARLLLGAVVCVLPAVAAAQDTAESSAMRTRSTAPPCFDNVNRYVDCGNGTVTDTVTGLVWLKQAECLGRVDWATGASLAASLADGACGLTDGSRPGQWRLPTLSEWQATMARAVALGCTLEGAGTPPALTNDAGTACLADGPTSFTGVEPGGYWTFTVNDQHPNNAWVASLQGTLHGFVFMAVKTFALPAWPVRAR
jgi:hypothetical protein